MLRHYLPIAAVLAAAALLFFAPWKPPGTSAQTGPMMGQPLDQLSGDDFDRAFLAEMTMHHAMAVMMARPAAENAPHQEVKDLASQIIADQTREIGEMRTWAREWYGLDLPDHLAMMETMHGGRAAPSQMPSQPGRHAGHGSTMGQPASELGPGPMSMGGMMGQTGTMRSGKMSMMADLWKLPPNRLEVVFMAMMIPHHQGAVDMATLAPERAAHQEIKDLARAIVDSQSAEIATLNGWLATWYGL